MNRGASLGSVCEAIEEKIKNVLIRQRVENVLAVPFARNDVFCPEYAQPLRDDRDGLVFESGKLRNAGRPLCQTSEQ